MRNFVDEQGSLICQDHTENLGYYRRSKNCWTVEYRDDEIAFAQEYDFSQTPFVDVSCYGFKKSLARQLSPVWAIQGFGNDRLIFQTLLKHNIQGACTDMFSVNYQLQAEKWVGEEYYHQCLQYFSPDEAKKVLYRFIQAINEQCQIMK